MNPSRPFILRPVATSLLMATIVLAGLIGLRFLPVSALPQVDYPTMQVRTLYPGAGPEVMADMVTAPLERQFGQMPGLQRMSSTSAPGASVITLQFELNESLDVAEQEVQAAINAASALLPTDLPAPPVYAKVNPADAPIMTLAVTSDTVPLPQVEDLVESRLAQKISEISGVGLVSISGGQRPAIRIDADSDRLAAMGLGVDGLRTAIGAANANGAKGSINGPSQTFAIDANDQLESPDDFRNLIIGYRDGAPIRVGDVAAVSQGTEDVRQASWANLRPAIVLNVQRQPGANVIATADAIKAQLPALQQSLPGSLKVSVLSDRTTGIRASVRDVELELLLAIGFVVLVILLFLGDRQATFIAAVAVPISLIGTCAAMLLLGFSLNNLSLMALTIATGFVVDDAIVMLENISRRMEEGLAPLDAALEGARQIGFTIISLTISLVAALIPLLFMGDVAGRLFREFAVTLAVSIGISAVVSLTLSPMLAARWLRPRDADPQAAPSPARRRYEAVLDRYARALDWSLDRRGLTLGCAGAAALLAVLLCLVIPKGLFPTQDTGQLLGKLYVSTSTPFPRLAQVQQAVDKLVLADPDVASLTAAAGVDGLNSTAPNEGSMLINLKAHRTTNQAQIMERLRGRVAQIPGVSLYLQPVQDLTVDAQSGPTQYRVSLQGADQAQVDLWARRLAARMGQDPKLSHVFTDAGQSMPAAYVALDRDSAARVNVTASSLDETLYSAFGQRIATTVFTDANQYRVILNADRTPFQSPEQLGGLQLPTGAATTPLSAVATVRATRAPVQITHVAQFPAATVGFDPAPGVSLGAATARVRAIEAEMHIPAAVSVQFLGAAAAYEGSLQNEFWLVLAALVCVYIVLGVLYESYVHPLTIISTLPPAAAGALLALLVTGQQLDVIGVIGLVLLIGIVKKNGIMMVDFALDAEREEGLAPREAIRKAALLRLRPILMTTFAALFAALPLMLGWGFGSELRRPLGIAIFGGLLVSQLITLFSTPAIYLALGDLARRRWRPGAAVAQGAA